MFLGRRRSGFPRAHTHTHTRTRETTRREAWLAPFSHFPRYFCRRKQHQALVYNTWPKASGNLHRGRLFSHLPIDMSETIPAIFHRGQPTKSFSLRELLPMGSFFRNQSGSRELSIHRWTTRNDVPSEMRDTEWGGSNDKGLEFDE